MKWYASEHRSQDRQGKRRAVAWACATNHRIAVRQGSNTTHPYYVCIDGMDLVQELGTFPTLHSAQLAAMTTFDRRQQDE